MTSPITPESRAAELWRGLPYEKTAIPVIAQEIRDAENAALERAAARIEEEDAAAFAHMTAPTARDCCKIIRSLKTKEI